MKAVSPDDVPLPPLREDLRIEAAAPLASGAPVWVIYDPARHRYFQIGRRTVEMLSSWAAGSVGALKSRLMAERGWRPGEAELSALIKFLFANELTSAPIEGRSVGYAGRAAAARRNAFLALAKAYLFFRVPLVRPERFLDAAAPFARFFFSRGFAIFTLLSGLIGLALASRQTDAFLAYAERFISLDGAIYFVGALIFVKVFHELGHAFQATLRGVRVMTMGVAFMVMFPLLYTDVSDAWRTKRRADKLMIDAGGVLVELSLAALATLLWVFLPDGPMRSAAFVVATTSWVLSLFVNLNPFMRFDGYYFLSDATGVSNLQPRSFAMAKWRLREFLFGLKAAPPEAVSAGMRRFMTIYAYGTWIYRPILFIGIALIVYNLFFKALGVLLFAIEIAFFIALPIAKEIGVWLSLRSDIIRSPRAWITGAVLAGLAILFVTPMPVTVRAPVTLGYADEVAIYPRLPGQLVEVRLAEGAAVEKGDVLARMASPDIASDIERARRRIELLELRIARGAADAEERTEALIFAKELESERSRLKGLEDEAALFTVTAPISGRIVDTDRRVRAQGWLGRDDRLAVIVDPGAVEIRGYLAEDDLPRIAAGAEGVFVPDDPRSPALDGVLREIADFAAERLSPGYLAAGNGGPIAVTAVDDGGDPRPIGSWFAIRADVSQDRAAPPATQISRGVFLIEGRAESWAERTIRQITRVLLRELGV